MNEWQVLPGGTFGYRACVLSFPLCGNGLLKPLDSGLRRAATGVLPSRRIQDFLPINDDGGLIYFLADLSYRPVRDQSTATTQPAPIRLICGHSGTQPPQLANPSLNRYSAPMQPQAATFDTHAFVKRLTGAGMPESQAEILAQGQADLLKAALA